MDSGLPKINKVLVLLATFNGSKFIEKQLETILNQSDVDVEILISDDKSTDNTIDVINRVSKGKENIKFLENKKKFGSAAPNFFNLVSNSEISSFDYVAFSDQDDVWHEDKLFSAIQKLKKFKCDALSSDVYAYWPNKNIKKLLKKSFPQKKYDFFFEGPGPGCSQVFTKSSFEKFKYFIIQNKNNLNHVDYHDWLAYVFYRYNNLKWVISDEPKMLYQQHDDNQIGANTGFFAKINRIKDIGNNWYRDQVVGMYELITNKKFEDFVTTEKLVFKPLSLRRKKSHSILVWLLISMRILRG